MSQSHSEGDAGLICAREPAGAPPILAGDWIRACPAWAGGLRCPWRVRVTVTAAPAGRELRLGVAEWEEVLAAIGGRTSIESVYAAPPGHRTPPKTQTSSVSDSDSLGWWICSDLDPHGW